MRWWVFINGIVLLLQALDKLQHEWEGAELGVLEYRDTGTYIIKVGAATLLCVQDNLLFIAKCCLSVHQQTL
jgi:hypothetical protein